MHLDFPELNNPTRLVRVPSEMDVPVTPRVLRVLDTPAMQRLKRISQLGLVTQVYPGAQHSRFEHSLGVYALARQVLIRLLASQPDFSRELDATSLRVFLLAVLVHDVGHWPYCHPIEDLRLDWVPKHESLARQLLCAGELGECIAHDWDVDPAAVADFLTGASPAGSSGACQVLQHVLNGPVDIDKMDYLQRDSLHAGVPYGRNFDASRLIASFCLNPDRTALAITDKGKTAAEMMVFSRYVMFSEVYWHHAVRSATAMLQRLVFSLADSCDPQDWLKQSDAEFAQEILRLAGKTPMDDLARSLFGPRRRLYKRVGEYSFSNAPEVHTALARRPYQELMHIGNCLIERLNASLSNALGPADLLIDAPPQKLEVQFRIPVRIGQRQTATYVELGEVSPVVKALATEQFDNYVKRARVFVTPDRVDEILASPIDLGEEILRIVEE